MDDRRRAQYSWALYDWANSAFATTVLAGFFPVFFKTYWAAGMPATESTARLGVTSGLASLLVVLLAPILGVIADRTGYRKRLLLRFAALGALMSGGLFFVAEGAWYIAGLLYLFGMLGFAGGNVTYDALLVDVAETDEFERLSALGFALGYLGGGLLYAINVWMVMSPASFGLADSADAVRWAFITVAVWWLVFSVPVLLFVREPPATVVEKSGGSATGLAWREMVISWRLLRQLPNALWFLLAYWCYIDGVDTVVRMAVDYGLSLGFAVEGLLLALLITQLVGFPSALLFGRFGDAFGAKRAIGLALVIYVIVVFWAWQMRETWEFYALAVAIGLAQGGIQSMSRALYARLIPKEHAGRLFGLYNMMGKFAAVVGPLMVAWVALTTGDSRSAILSLLSLFLLGGVLLLRVDAQAGARDAGRV